MIATAIKIPAIINPAAVLPSFISFGKSYGTARSITHFAKNISAIPNAPHIMVLTISIKISIFSSLSVAYTTLTFKGYSPFYLPELVPPPENILEDVLLCLAERKVDVYNT